MPRNTLHTPVFGLLVLASLSAHAANNGVIHGNLPFTAGAFGNAGAFQSGAYITLPDFSSALGSTFTEVFRVRRSSVPWGIEVLTASGGSASFQTSWVAIQVSGHLVFQGNGFREVDSGVTITDGAWHRVMLVYTPTTVTAYVDGSSGVVGPNSGTPSGPAAIGSFGDGNFATLAQIDEVAWFTSDRHAVETSAPTAPYASNTPGLVALYHLDNDATDAATGGQTVPPAPPMVTVTPSSFPLGVVTPFTLTNSGTNWTTSTRPTVSGGVGAYLSNIAVNGQTITATLLPGTTASTLTLGTTSDSATADVSAVVNLTTAVSFHGDSLTRGYRGSGDNTVNATRLAVVQLGLGPTATIYNDGLGGQNIQNMMADYASSAGAHYLPGKINVLVVEGGHNSFAQGETVQQVEADWRTYFATVRAQHPDVLIVWETDLPSANPGYPADFDSKRDQVNAWARANYPQLGVCQLSDIAADAVIGQDGQEYDLANFNDDNSHPTDAGYTRMGNADLQAIRAALRGCAVQSGQ